MWGCDLRGSWVCKATPPGLRCVLRVRPAAAVLTTALPSEKSSFCAPAADKEIVNTKSSVLLPSVSSCFLCQMFRFSATSDVPENHRFSGGILEPGHFLGCLYAHA